MSKYKVGDIIYGKDGKYKLDRLIESGGMDSNIYLAHNINRPKGDDPYWEQTHKNVAVKIVDRKWDIDSGEWNKMRDEIVTSRRSSKIDNVVKFYDILNENNQVIIFVMEYIKGETLRKIIDKNGHLNVKESLYFIKKVVEVLKDLHNFQHKIIHRDIKPENIMVSDDYTKVKIIDFGISSVVYTKYHKVLTYEDEIWGTYAYISPEISGLTDANKRGIVINEQFDFFSIGIILYEMLIGKKPFWSEDYETNEVFQLPLKYDIFPLNKIDVNIPNAVENIIFRCLASKKEDKKYRYRKAEEIIKDIESIESNFDNAFKAKLLKPEHKRVYIAKKIFDVQSEKNRLSIWFQPWFVTTILITVAIIVITTILFVYVL